MSEKLEIPDFDDRPWDGPFNDLSFTTNPFADLTAQCAEIVGETIERRRVRRVREGLAGLTDEERLDLFAEYCAYCGSKDPSCKCWNDE